MKIKNSNFAFTLVELMVVIGITLVFFALVTPNLLKTQHKASVDEVVLTLIADLKLAQTKAMTGDTEGRASPDVYGIYFDQAQSQYVLFHGSTYDPSDSDNFVIDLPSSIEFSDISFPASQVVFSRINGEVSGFLAGQNSVTLQSGQGDQERTIQINKLGVVTSAN